MWWLVGGVGGVVAALAVYDLVQKRHSILRNVPVIGHLRFLLEAVGPELRQYIVTDNDEERPFSRDQRRWVYASAKRENNVFGFGTDNDLETTSNYLIVKHAAFPERGPDTGDLARPPHWRVPAAKVIGEFRDRPGKFRPDSIVNISGMSFGSLSGAAVSALNRGAQLAGCLHATGEGGVTAHHAHGGDLVWQIGTGYFGCRTATGQFDLDQFRATLDRYPTIRAIEIKLSQGAKPGLGGLLPGAKVTREIAAIRGVPAGVDCHSPATHSAFTSIDSMLDFAELLASTSGRPVGIKSAVGDLGFWQRLGDRLGEDPGRAIDFIVVDGGEGGTGAAPLAFADHVALPFKIGFSRVYREFAARRLTDRIVFVGSGKLGFPQDALLAFALGCDTINVGREAMLAIGCIQAQRCHTGHCPTGVATQSRWLARGLDPTDKAVRCAQYIETLRQEVLQLSWAAGATHPALITPDVIEFVDDRFGARSARDVFGYDLDWGRPSATDCDAVAAMSLPPHTSMP